MKKAPLLAALLCVLCWLKGAGQITVSDTITTQTGPPDTLTSNIAGLENKKPTPEKYGDHRELLYGHTRDLAVLIIEMRTINPDKRCNLPNREPLDRLLIVREGSLMVTVGEKREWVGTGGIALIPADAEADLENTGTKNTSCWLLYFESKKGAMDLERDKRAGGALFLNWTDLKMKKTDKGESRPMFSRPIAWLSKIDMHATTLDPNQISHPQHVHRNEEIIIMRSGKVRMHIGNDYRKATAGDIVYLPSGVPHDLENGPDGRCEYFALQWEP